MQKKISTQHHASYKNKSPISAHARKTKFLNLIVGLIFVFLPLVSKANNSTTLFQLNNFSLGFNIGGGVNYYKPAFSPITVKNADHASFAWGVHLTEDFNRYLALDLGYINYGFYENYGSGKAFCDMSGNCDYQAPDLPKGIFNTKLTISNDIDVQSFYLAMLLKYPILTQQSLYGRFGATYSLARIQSHVTVDPELGGIGPTIIQTVPIRNINRIYPMIGVGWRYDISQHMYMNSEFDWNYIMKMYRTTENNKYDGSIFPMAIMLGIGYRL